jgi:hypothetical protein
MPQTGTGFVLSVIISGTPHEITKSTSHDWGQSANMLDISTKNSGGYKEVMPGQKEFSLSGEFLFEPDDTYNYDYLYDAWDGGDKLQMQLSDGVTGHKKYTFYAYPSNLQRSDPNAETATFTCDFGVTGQVTVATI